ncbi:Uncharacterised protein [Actinomyces bovis]|uniref:Uncharacterized protein n=1 Tax=Actinomyces bovis TaxID=1658 RepID=A0ABY1VNT5_9ACTO|nr:hypothetical protein [Actinomyces bovis]SPT53776.1 Uncharacterised protein [Actinomyces bovis]VEG53124.1 Uncharacterised protein [Actinomyces israelii]
MSDRVEVEVTVTMRPTSGGPAHSSVARVCPVVVSTVSSSRDDVVETINSARSCLIDCSSLVLVDLADTVAHLLVADPPPPAGFRDVCLTPDMAIRIRGMYSLARPLSAVELDLLPAGSVVECRAGRHVGRQWRQDGWFARTHKRLGTSEVTAWQQIPVPSLPPVLRVRRADELALTYALRLVHVPGVSAPHSASRQEKSK